MINLFLSIGGIIVTVAIFVAGQLLVRIFLDPINEQRKAIGKLAFYLCAYPNTKESKLTVRGAPQQPDPKDLQKLAGELVSTMYTIPLYRLFESLHLVESGAKIREASLLLLEWRTIVGELSPKMVGLNQRMQFCADKLRKLIDVKNWLADFNEQQLLSASVIDLIPMEIEKPA
jgi:hypothetical protein